MNIKFLPKRLGCFLLAGALFLGTAGCGAPKEPDNEENKPITLTGEMVPVADYQEIKFDLSDLTQYRRKGEHLLYLEKQWDKEQEMSVGTLYQVNLDGTGAPEVLYTGAAEENTLQCFSLGHDDSFYFLERKKGEDGTDMLYLRMLDQNFQEIYMKALEDEDFQQATEESIGSFTNVHVDADGNFLITDHGDNVMTDHGDNAYFFDKEGRYLGSDTIQVPQGQFIDAGEQGCFFARQDGNAFSISSYLFQKIDFAAGRLNDAESRDLSAATNGMENMSILSGYELGILISTETNLCSYNYNTGEITELLSWRSVNANGSMLQEIHLLQKDFPPENLNGYTVPLTEPQEADANAENIPEVAPVLEAFFCSPYFGSGQDPEIIRLGYLDRGYVPEKQTVTLGIVYIPTIRMGQLVRRFNRSNAEYEIVLKNYEDIDSFTDMLVLNPTEIPDMLEISYISKDMLESKGLLEDLKPYFQESDVVGEDDILETIWQNSKSNGKITSIMIGFSINSLTTSAETLPTDGWTYGQLFELNETYPDSKLLSVYTPVSVWILLSNTLSSYVDWDKKECHFDSPEFIRLLENIKNLNYPENQEEQRVFHEDEEIRKLLKKEFLLQRSSYSSPYNYQWMQSQHGGKARDVGYPTQDGELCFLLHPLMQYAIFSNSPNKDGAWTFLEYMLSEEEQSWYGSDYGGFPVRKDAFETYLTKPYDPAHPMAEEAYSEETTERIRLAVEHLHLEESMASGELSDIIYEEIQAFFVGDKTAEQCVEIIQNRAQLYLDENFH